MINLTREEAQQVLDALEKGAWDTLRGRNAAETLRARLSEPDGIEGQVKVQIRTDKEWVRVPSLEALIATGFMPQNT